MGTGKVFPGILEHGARICIYKVEAIFQKGAAASKLTRQSCVANMRAIGKKSKGKEIGG